jgi:CheY-like chemotaxis protein
LKTTTKQVRPCIDGFANARNEWLWSYLRAQHDELNIPIIALTADVTTIDADKARAVGMNDYISKPIDEQLLYKK